MKALIVCNNNERSRLAADRARELFLASGDEAVVTEKGPSENADLCVVVGGDGTVLHAGKEAALRGIPVLALNTGRVGFLTVPEKREAVGVSQLLRNAHRERRMLLEFGVFGADGGLLSSGFALNEAVVSRGGISRIIDIEVAVDGCEIYTVRGDGVILATPTGSTAYSMSAGGPIVEPEAEAFILTPICAHSISAKPFVIGAQKTISIKTEKLHTRRAYLSIDGNSVMDLSSGDRMIVRRSEHRTMMVRMGDKTFFETAYEKL
jgi:NAD+ kinase